MESLRSILCKKLKDLDSKCDKYLAFNKDDEYLQRFKEYLNAIYNWEEGDSLKTLVQNYSKAVLDITYFEENKLVEDDFASMNAIDKMENIITNLNEIEAVCKEYTDDPISFLGNEISECLLWRKGALLYMYCATMEAKGLVTNSEIKSFLEYLYRGINYINDMINIRKPLMVAKKSMELKDDTLFLLSEGIYNDNAVLALMYAGEMCFWFKKYFNDQFPLPPNFQPNDLGKQFLEKFIKVTDGPLRGRGWNASKARELVSVFCT